MEVRALTAAQYDDSPITLRPDPASGAERTVVVVRDAATGEDVDRFEIPVSGDPVDWPVSEKNGDPFPPGRYTFHLQSIANDVPFSEDQIAIFSEVEELRMINGETRLVLAGGGDIAAAEVQAVRRPDPPLE
jgi:flagellar basal-body rod modification protein FlgD